MCCHGGKAVCGPNSMSFKDPDSIAPWTASWQFESAASGSNRPPLDLLIEPSWFEFTDLLPKGARMLELATGNGAVARSCAERARARRKPLEIEAVDAADINPPGLLPDADGHLPKIRFQGGVWLEDLPFRDDEFHAVISQFGFEYADEALTVSEVSRVLSPNGKLRLVIHARGGAVWEDINYRHKRLSEVLAENGAANLVLTLVRAQQKHDVNTFNRKVKRLAAAANKARELAEQPPSDDSALFYAREFLYVWSHRRQYRLNDLLRSLEDGWAHATGTDTRYGQMLRVARSAEDIAALCERFKTAGLTINAVRQVCSPENAAPVAWQVDASRSG